MMPASGAREPAARGALPPAAHARTAGVHPACRRGGAPPCTEAECGDGKLNRSAGESCDDGEETDECDDDCTTPRCGDDNVNEAAGEQCDEGGVDTAACNKDCSLADCGDGYVNVAAGEQCDTGGPSSFCNANCQLSACGDGETDTASGEDCDDAGQSATCNLNCSTAMCGDGIVNSSFLVDPFHASDATATEQCDPGTGPTGSLQRASSSSPACDRDCTFARCGDGYENSQAGEQCDDAYVASGPKPHGPSCDSDCTLAACGDGTVNPFFEVDLLESNSTLPGEQCDPGTGTTGNNRRAANDTALCNRDCSAPRCGDRYTNSLAGEQCDDAFVASGSKPNTATCDNDCTFPACGDGVVNGAFSIRLMHDNSSAPSEQCDPGTGTTADSKRAAGGTNLCDPDCSSARCGDAYVNPARGETCEFAYVQSSSYVPTPRADCDSDCTAPECGDGLVNGPAGENCDPGPSIIPS